MTKRSPEMTEAIANNLSMGMGRVDTCTIVGISYETFTVWMKDPEFSESIKKAELACKSRNIGLIQAAAAGRKPFAHPNAFWAAWWLERKFPEEFANQVKHSNPDGTPLNLHAAAVLIIQNQREGKNARAIASAEHPAIDVVASATAA